MSDRFKKKSTIMIKILFNNIENRPDELQNFTLYPLTIYVNFNFLNRMHTGIWSITRNNMDNL